MKNVVLKSRFLIPIYGSEVLLIVAHDAVKAFNRYTNKFKEKKEEKDGFKAMAVKGTGNEYGLFFHADSIGSDFIGHEIKHIVDYIMEHIGAKPPRPGKLTKQEKRVLEEPEAYLTGYLHRRIYALLKKHKIKLNN